MQLGDESDPFGTNERLFFVQSASVAHLVHVRSTPPRAAVAPSSCCCCSSSSSSSSSSIAAVILLQRISITLIFVHACLIVVVVRF